MSTYKLTRNDADAILCALPLIMNIGPENPTQAQINANSCLTAGSKLHSMSGSLTPNEFRVCSLAVDLALDILHGNTDLACIVGVDADWKQELGQWFFTFNRLQPIFDNNIRPR